MDDRVREFRAGVADLGEPGRGRRYPRSLQNVAIWYWRDVREAGQPLREAAAELGVSDATLQRWADADSEDPIDGEMHEVVVKEPAEPLGLFVVTPDGYRVEGLDLTEASLLLRSLR